MLVFTYSFVEYLCGRVKATRVTYKTVTSMSIIKYVEFQQNIRGFASFNFEKLLSQKILK